MHFAKLLTLVAPFVAVVAALPHAGSELQTRGYTYTPADCTVSPLRASAFHSLR